MTRICRPPLVPRLQNRPKSLPGSTCGGAVQLSHARTAGGVKYAYVLSLTFGMTLNKSFVQCITTEQPPTNPCAYCTRKHLTCEYVAVDGPFGHSRTESPDFPAADRSESGTDSSPSPSPPLWTPPVTPSYFSPQPLRRTSPLPYLEQEASDPSLRYLSPSPFCSTQPALPSIRRSSHHDTSNQRLSGLRRGYDCPTPDFVPHPYRRPSAGGGDSDVYDLQAAQAYQYLSSRASSSHTVYPCPPEESLDFFMDYTQMPSIDAMRYEWPPIFSATCSPHG